MKKAFLRILTLAAAFAGGSALAADGDIWQILPCDEAGTTMSASASSAANPIPAGSNLYFKVRLVRRNGENGTCWHIQNKVSPGKDDYLNPLRICLYVSGKPTYADYVGEVEHETYFTDVIFRYTVKPGDYALPIKLGTASGPADDKYNEDVSYYFDPLTSWRWEFVCKDGDTEVKGANMWFFYGDALAKRAIPTSRTTGIDYSLKEANYNVRTISFDEDWESEGSLWRTVHQNSRTIKIGSTPSLVSKSGPEELTTLYVWSDNEDAVVITNKPGSSSVSVRAVNMKVSSKPDVYRTVQVAAITFERGQTASEFEIWGVKEGETANLVLSAYDRYNYWASTNDRENDFVTVPVVCGEELPPSVKVTPGKTKIVATKDYDYYQTELSVYFTQATTNDVTFTITPSLEADASADWKDYIAIYDQQELGGTLPSAATNITYTIPKGSTVPMENGAQKRIYLFALRSDSKVSGTKHLVFTPTTENAAAKADLKGWNLPTGAITIEAEKPVIEEPEEGDDSLSAVAGADRTLRIKVVDTYADMNVVSNGYQIFIIKDQDTETEFVAVGGESARYAIGTGGYLYLTNALGTASTTLPMVKYSQTDHVNKSIVKVKSPISQLESDERKFTVTVTAPASVTIDTADGTYSFEEGDTVSLKFTLSKQNDTGGSIYAFLKPVNADSTAAISCGFLAESGGAGLEIGEYGTTASGTATLKDGYLGAQFQYKVELRTARDYDSGTTVASFLCSKSVSLSSANVVPTVESVKMGLNKMVKLDDGRWGYKARVARDVTQSFKAVVNEPGQNDLDATGDDRFRAYWTFTSPGGEAQGPVGGDAEGCLFGDPDSVPAQFQFTEAGEWTVTVVLRDKDMAKDGAEFSFVVTVVDQPTMNIVCYDKLGSPRTDAYETEADDLTLKLSLDFNTCNFDLHIGLSLLGDDSASELLLSTNRYVLTGADAQTKYGALYPSVKFSDYPYVVVLPKGRYDTAREIYVDSLDGTRHSRFEITPTMLTTDVVPNTADPDNPGQKCPANKYFYGNTTKLSLHNVAPQVTDSDFDPVPGTNHIATTIGAANVISWDFSDIEHDFTKTVGSQHGILVQLTCGGATLFTTNVTSSSEAAGRCSFAFSSSGEKYVRLTIQDPDGGKPERTLEWIYDVAVAKTMTVVPHGPGSSSSGLYLNTYGEGRVYASSPTDVGSSGYSDVVVSAFKHTVNCFLAGSRTVYGYGYKVGDVDGSVFHYPYTHVDGDKTDYNVKRNTKISTEGDSNEVGGYVYETSSVKNRDRDGRPADSFLYAWVVKSTEEDSSGTWSVLAYKPEAPLAWDNYRDAGTEISLPTEVVDADEDDAKSGTYPDTAVEAVFSLEYLASDNMGDINFDGIPDAWFHKSSFAFTTSSESVNVETGVSSTEETAVDDTTSVAAYNEDEDLLPDFKANGAAYMLDYSSSRPFTAILELRGYGEGLNDAPYNNSYVMLTGFKPDRNYADPDADETSTLSKVEYLAWCEYAAANGLSAEAPADWEKWSPENPTDPTASDTDGDGLDDGFEYALWYRAHVGFLDATTGAHTYLTGRRYDPKNPGVGTLITSAQIEKTFNPTVPFDESAITLDTDNDGLPDVLEFELGTNPVDFDSDGDGLPDGWELSVSLTDPLLAATDGTTLDGLRNTDGDAMAYTDTPRAPAVRPTPTSNQKWRTFAVIDANGDSDGVQWYAARHADYAAKFEVTVVEDDGAEQNPQALTATHFVADGVDYLTTDANFATVGAGSEKRLATALDRTKTWTAVAGDDASVEEAGLAVASAEWVRLMPTRLEAGAAVSDDQEGATYAILKFANAPGTTAQISHAAWLYGSGNAVAGSGETAESTASFGKLALARYAAPAKESELAALPLESRDVALLHYLVYQEYGFDPRTAWSATTPLAARWGTSASGGSTSSYEGVVGEGVGGYAGVSTRTRKFTNYDEFLVLTFFLNNGTMAEVNLVPDYDSVTWPSLWRMYTTNPRGPGETSAQDVETDQDAEESAGSSKLVDATLSDNGADTDEDGVPDGWELYVMAGAKSMKGVFQFASPYASWSRPVSTGTEEVDTAFPESYFSPFVASAQDSSTDNKLYVGKDETDGLTEYQEFAGTDSCGAYTNVSTTVVRPTEHAKWLNKFFPSDPWLADTDDDGVKDNEEFGSFVYGTPADDGASKFLPGAGLNPCTVDTDMDGLPDGWEKQYAGTWDSANGIQDRDHGIVNGMDGTVQDARTASNAAVNRDYDCDGLENWQEYLTHAMRCWRYDDPYSTWTSIPFNRYYQPYPGSNVGFFAPDFDALGIGTPDDDPEDRFAEFWYRTLVDQESPLYNPHLVYDQASGAQYLTRVDKGWDLNYADYAVAKEKAPGGVYYYFAHRVGAKKYAEQWAERASWVENAAPNTYVGCSPLKADTDQDGMDDYYELFHGLNPLLGESGVTTKVSDPCDVVSSIAGADKMPIYAESGLVWWYDEANHPVKLRGNNKYYDFVAFPWLAGAQTADPDGDDVRNYIEAIMPHLATTTWLHTDPTPQWMTDTSYSNSLVRLHYRMPMRCSEVTLNGVDRSETAVSAMKVEDENGDLVPGFAYDGQNYYFRDFDGFVDEEQKGQVTIPAFFATFGIDRFQWFGDSSFKVGSAYLDARTADYTLVGDYAFSFEENEGYDTDHDGVGDSEETKGEFTEASDPQLAESPLRRQAMYFPGENAVLQSMPKVKEQHPVEGSVYPANLTFMQYTVECWARPERTDDAILVERAIWAQSSAAGDEDLIRKNFQLAIRDGRWFTKYDTSGTQAGSDAHILSKTAVEAGVWTHVAATYDGKELILYVNGKADGDPNQAVASASQPEYGLHALNVSVGGVSHAQYGSYAAILIGAGLKTYADTGLSFSAQTVGRALDLTSTLAEGEDTAAVWAKNYKGFFKGWIDEVRIWDGARTAAEIEASRDVRMKADAMVTARASFYDDWADGKHRYEKDDSGNDYAVSAELVHHYAFDAILGAENAESLAVVPRAFADGAKAPYARPEGYRINWWARILAKYGSQYAGEANYVPWIADTVAHLPRLDGTTVDSAYWSEDYEGSTLGTYKFARTAEPYAMWHQYYGAADAGEYGSTALRHYLATQTNNTSNLDQLFAFTGRYAYQSGCDLLPLGGAYARYSDTMWDDQGASTPQELTGGDSNANGLPDWWERYADENYRIEPAEPLTYVTLVKYRGQTMTAGEAYQRDLARGFYLKSDGSVAVGPTAYAQTADADLNGLPDWWEKLYRISGEEALADHDNDGLANYTEYMLSEVFDFGVLFSPTMCNSANGAYPDYFFRIGSLYAGEIFTDHDLVDDAWEDLYDRSYSSRLVYDAFQDEDEDGWCNRSENRYAKNCLPTMADQQSHFTSADGRIADYPIPTIALTVRYNGENTEAVAAAPLNVAMSTRADGEYARSQDATFAIDALTEDERRSGAGEKSDGSKSSTESEATSYTRILGKWSNRHVIGTLTPGNIAANSLSLQFCSDPSSVIYSWEVYSTVYEYWSAKRGTRLEYDADRRKYGEANVELLSTESAYSTLEGLELRTAENTSVATWIHSKLGTTLGTVNLTTGAFDLDLGALAGGYVVGSNGTVEASLEDQTYRITYSANKSTDLPRHLYLGQATTGHVREGKNEVFVWADTGKEAGVWEPGEPYGYIRGLEVSWKGTSAEVELTEQTPITQRVDLWNDEGDREETYDSLTQKLADDIKLKHYSESVEKAKLEELAKWQTGNQIADSSKIADLMSDTLPVRVRAVRWLVNGTPVYSMSMPARVVVDKKFDASLRRNLTERDFLSDAAFDIDWENLKKEVVDSDYLTGVEVTSVSYMLVVGDGETTWSSNGDTNIVVNALQSVITRHFGSARVQPVPVSPGASGLGVVTTPNPTFKWKMECPSLEGYTAFRIVVSNEAGQVVWDSGIKNAPVRDSDGNYCYEAPLFVGDKTTSGAVFANKQSYFWNVAMYNAKYSDETDAYGKAGRFYMNLAENGFYSGAARVAVKYFGPAKSYEGKVIRVRAYASPDFTGFPASAGYVADPDHAVSGVGVTTGDAAENARVAGLSSGTYYLQAFVDSNGNGVCDDWETQGYYCRRDGTTADWLDPTGIALGSILGEGDLFTIYLEDSDTDGDGLPDAWEYASFGGLDVRGVELLSETPAGECVVNSDLSGALTLRSGAAENLGGGLAARALTSFQNAGVVALALGADVSADESFAQAITGAVSAELAEDGVSIKNLSVEDGKITIEVAAETEVSRAASNPLAAALDLAEPTLTVQCYVSVAADLASGWTELKPVTITVGDQAAAVDVSKLVEAEGLAIKPQFFKVRLEK